jgi:hypothetical protein
MPEFADGIPLSALELNKISAGQRYIQGLQLFNYAQKVIYREVPVYMMRTHRYLHWRVSDATNMTLRINSVVALTGVSGDASGVLDLNIVSNLPVGSVYSLFWREEEEETGTGVYFKESPNTTLTVAYPYTTPTFANGSTVPAAKLNALAGNMQHLLDYHAAPPSGGFARSIFNLEKVASDEHAANKEYWMQKLYRYLYVYIYHTYSGSSGKNRTTRVYVNGKQVFNAEAGSGRPNPLYYAFAFDLQGSDHTIYLQPSAVTPTITSLTTPITDQAWYTITVRGRVGSGSDVQDQVYVNLLGEMPEKAYL